MPTRIVNFTWASGATGSISQYVGYHNGALAYVSNMTGWASAAGNSTFSLRGAPASGVSHVSIVNASITTETDGRIYDISQVAGVPYLSIGFNSIPSSAGTISVMLRDDNY